MGEPSLSVGPGRRLDSVSVFQDTVNLMVLIFVDDSPVSKDDSRVPRHTLHRQSCAAFVST